MPQLVNISTQYRNKLKNGDAFTDNISDFTTNQTGNVIIQIDSPSYNSARIEIK